MWVRLCLDNDKAGREAQERIANLVRAQKLAVNLFAMKWPQEFPEKCDIRDLVRDGVNVVEFSREHCVPVTASEQRLLLVRGDQIPEEKMDWLWPGHIPFGSFVSLSGLMGSHKSGIARDLAARVTAGLPMPGSSEVTAHSDVVYFTSEDPASQVRDLVSIHGGNLKRLHVPAVGRTSGFSKRRLGSH